MCYCLRISYYISSHIYDIAFSLKLKVFGGNCTLRNEGFTREVWQSLIIQSWIIELHSFDIMINLAWYRFDAIYLNICVRWPQCLILHTQAFIWELYSRLFRSCIEPLLSLLRILTQTNVSTLNMTLKLKVLERYI